MSMINKLIGDDYLRDEYWEEIGEYINIGTFTGKGKGLSEHIRNRILNVIREGSRLCIRIIVHWKRRSGLLIIRNYGIS